MSINGLPTDEWTYDESTCQVTVQVPSTPCDQQVTVAVQRSASGIDTPERSTLVSRQYFDIQGREITQPARASRYPVYIVRSVWSDGHVTTTKMRQ